MKKVVYTVVTGQFNPRELEYSNDGWDHICFSDHKIKTKCWDVRIIKKKYGNKKTSREYKILNDKFLMGYDLSIYIDSRFTIRQDLDVLVKKHLYDNMAMMEHNKRTCIYDEAETCKRLGLDDKSTIDKQMDRYKKEGYPKNNGLAACGIMIRKHNTPQLIKLMSLWFDEVVNGSWRDQLSFNYALWKNPIKINYVPFYKFYNAMK